ESSTAHDPQFVGGLAPWALRHDLEALRRHKRIREAKSETSRTEVALLEPKAQTKAMGIEAANNTPWSEVRKWMTDEFCPRSVIQRMEQEVYNLKMKGMDIDGYTN
nr:putative reverse transcriptase domain-containing protein [Tanacetum cinerariifolium]